jgi:hypothetical protein
VRCPSAIVGRAVALAYAKLAHSKSMPQVTKCSGTSALEALDPR